MNIKNRLMLCCTALMLSAVAVKAQNVRIGVKAGLNLPNITGGGHDTPVSEGYASRTALGMGIFTEIELCPALSLRVGAEYSGQGGKKDGMQAMPFSRLVTEMATQMASSGIDQSLLAKLQGITALMPAYFYADVKNTVKFDYVMIPIMAQYNLHLGQSPWTAYFNLGPFVSFLVSGKQVTKGTSKMYVDKDISKGTLGDMVSGPLGQTALGALGLPQNVLDGITAAFTSDVPSGTTNITGEMKTVNVGIVGNVGVRYSCGSNGFFLEGGGNYGFIPVQKDDANGSNRLGAATVQLGYTRSFN